MKTINNFLYLPVPIGSKEHTANHDTIFFIDKNGDRKSIYCPIGNGIGYEIVCLASEMTEEVAKGLVIQNKISGRYNDYVKTSLSVGKYGACFLDTAIESFHSKMQANEMYLVNPMGLNEPQLEPVCCGRWVSSMFDENQPACCDRPEPSQESLERVHYWQSYQDKLSDYVILKRK